MLTHFTNMLPFGPGQDNRGDMYWPELILGSINLDLLARNLNFNAVY